MITHRSWLGISNRECLIESHQSRVSYLQHRRSNPQFTTLPTPWAPPDEFTGETT
jgi:hypothetical protein